jgi:hypothetical protein
LCAGGWRQSVPVSIRKCRIAAIEQALVFGERRLTGADAYSPYRPSRDSREPGNGPEWASAIGHYPGDQLVLDFLGFNEIQFRATAV